MTTTKPATLYQLIVARGFKNKSAFARAIDIQAQTLQLMQRGYVPGPELLTKIATALSVTDKELIAICRSSVK